MVHEHNTFLCICIGKDIQLQNRKSLAITTRGGLYSESPMKEVNSGDEHLTNLLNFVGIKDTNIVALDGTNVLSEDVMTPMFEKTKEELIELAAKF